jgi:hypothetical protein
MGDYNIHAVAAEYYWFSRSLNVYNDIVPVRTLPDQYAAKLISIFAADKIEFPYMDWYLFMIATKNGHGSAHNFRATIEGSLVAALGAPHAE